MIMVGNQADETLCTLLVRSASTGAPSGALQRHVFSVSVNYNTETLVEKNTI
jgi:hypothetical protein